MVGPLIQTKFQILELSDSGYKIEMFDMFQGVKSENINNKPKTLKKNRSEEI